MLHTTNSASLTLSKPTKHNKVGSLILQGCKKGSQKIQFKKTILPIHEHKQNIIILNKPKKKPSTKNLTSDSGFSSISCPQTETMMEDMLSNTEHELDRMVSQHYILRTAFNADFSAPISSFDKKTVLDIGCGTGTWTMEMATRFPTATFIGLDKQVNFPQNIKPKNCHFKQFCIDTNYVRLPFEDASVDYIFQRDLNWNLTKHNWVPLVEEYYRILKPGGWLEIVEADIETQSSSFYEDSLINKLIYSFYARQQDPFISKRLSSLMAEAGFRRIQSDFQSIPLGWGYQKLSVNQQNTKKTIRCSEFARAASSHRLELLKSLQSWFMREHNISQSKYEAYLEQLPTE
ncbi:hypothetical protein CU098_004826, partial [Rhizopus stolonifer]